VDFPATSRYWIRHLQRTTHQGAAEEYREEAWPREDGNKKWVEMWDIERHTGIASMVY